jgi:serine/threonine protein kinase
MPEYFSDDLADFIRRLLVLDPESRMTEEEALQHPYIRRNVK